MEDSDIAIKALLGMDADPTSTRAEPGQCVDQGYLRDLERANQSNSIK